MYVSSPQLDTFTTLACNRMRHGHGAVLLLDGPPGAGKTAFAKHLADKVGADLHYYAGAPDKERDLLYEVDVSGVLARENAWVPGPAWRAFTESISSPTVLLVDEVDKTSAGFDAFLLRLLEEFAFRAPDGSTVTATPANLLVVLTTNGRRELRPEVLRRAQRVSVPLPGRARTAEIVEQIAGRELPPSLIDVLLRLGEALRQQTPEMAPSPKEVALCALDLMELASLDVSSDVWRDVAASWLVKGAGPAVLDAAVDRTYRWARALRTEATR